MNHLIRYGILDPIFGAKNFLNHIVWKRTSHPKGSQFDAKSYGVVTDSIFLYAKSDEYFFSEKAVRIPLSPEELVIKYPKSDERGPYYEYPILRSPSKGARPNLVYEYKGFTPPYYGWVVCREKLEEIDLRGDLGWREGGNPFRKFRPHEDPGHLVDSLWEDIERLASNSKEAIKYPTQKPEALLERIIKASSNEGTD